MVLDPSRWPSPVAIAHRGSRSLWPENTLRSFQSAYDLGFRNFETDVHVTADGVLVCFHDPTANRTTNGFGPISMMTFADLRSLDAGYNHLVDGEYPFRETGVSVPTFEELMTTFPDCSVVVDMKTDGVEEPLAAIASDATIGDRLIVGSFSDRRLTRFRDLTEGSVPTSAGPKEVIEMFRSARFGQSPHVGVAAMQIPTIYNGLRLISPDLIETAKTNEVAVHVWTVNIESEMHELLDLGVDGLISDRPDLLRGVLEDRGQWSS